MTTKRTHLNGLTPEQGEQIASAIHFIVTTVFNDLQEAIGERFDNDDLMSTVADHLHDYKDLYRHCGYEPNVDDATHAAWLAIDGATRRKWMLANFRYV